MKLRWPFITRKEHEKKIEELEQRFLDIERHFVTKRGEHGEIVETLADRRRRATPPKGITMAQLCKWLEQTDDGRRNPQEPVSKPKVVHGQPA